MGKTLLSPGFRFHPTDVELVKYYLKRKILGRKLHFEAISEVDIYKYAPWDLPDKACLDSRDLKWYFFCPREKKYASGARMKRATESGYWKTTGKDRPVNYNGEVVGMIKTLVFHTGRAPKGDRTDWVMHEYRLQEKNLADRGVVQDSYVLCMVFKKEGPGPRNGAQYGAPFREEDWTDHEEDNRAEVGPSVMVTFQNNLLPNRNHVACNSHTLESTGNVFSPESCVSDMVPPSSEVTLPVTANDDPVEKVQSFDDDDILAMLGYFIEGEPFEVTGNNQNKDANNVNHVDPATAAAHDGNDIFKDLADLDNLAYGFHFSNAHITPSFDEAFPTGDDRSFLELVDLDAPLSRPAGASEDDIYTFPAVQPSLWPHTAHNLDGF